MLNIVTTMILPGGWHFLSPEGYRIPHKGELPNPQAVVDALTAYRLENNLPVGNPEGDLETYVCTNFPTWCRQRPEPPQPAQVQQGLRNVDLVIQWANILYTHVGQLQLVPQREADARAAICSACPKQMPWSRDCPPCVTSAQRLLNILRQGKDTPQGQTGVLQGCSLHGWDNRTAVHIDRAHLNPQVNPTAPDACWMKQP